MLKLNVKVTASALLLLVLPLAGCAVDGFEDDQAMKPYGGSKQHPIKVTNGKAYVEGCGDWSENVADTSSNEMANNHGCAVQANIAAMAAYPADLTGNNRHLPRPLGEVQYTAIQKLTDAAGGSSGSSGGAASGGAEAAPTN
jgi:Pilus biogenesis CpaD protein (pilus_cpaD)